VVDAGVFFGLGGYGVVDAGVFFGLGGYSVVDAGVFFGLGGYGVVVDLSSKRRGLRFVVDARVFFFLFSAATT
jgi:hypothetical protein